MILYFTMPQKTVIVLMNDRSPAKNKSHYKNYTRRFQTFMNYNHI